MFNKKLDEEVWSVREKALGDRMAKERRKEKKVKEVGVGGYAAMNARNRHDGCVNSRRGQPRERRRSRRRRR